MEKKKTTNRKWKSYLPLTIILLVLMVGLVGVGAYFLSTNNQEPVVVDEPEEEKLRLPLNCMTEEEVKQLSTYISQLSDEELAALREEAANGVTDERTLRILLLLEEELNIKVAKDIEIITEMPVKGTKSLTGAVQIKLFLGAKVDNGSILSVADGAKLTVNELVLDANGVSSAVVVNRGATFDMQSGEILYGSAYGIHNKGTTYVSGGKITQCLAAAVGVEKDAKTYISDGNFVDNIKNIIWISAQGEVEITGGVFDGCHEYAFMNAGTFTMKGGTVKNILDEKKGYVLRNNNGAAVIDGGDSYIEFVNCKYGFFNEFYTAGGSAKLVINKVYAHDFNGYFGNVGKGEATITNCKIENMGTTGIRVTDATVKLENISIKNTAESAIIINAPSKVTAKNIQVDGVKTGNGCTVYGATVQMNNVDIKNVAEMGFSLSSKKVDEKDVAAAVTLTNCTVSGAKGNILTKNKSTLTATNCTFQETERTNVMLQGGQTTFTNCKIYGALAEGCSVVSIQKDVPVTMTDTEVANGQRGIYLAGSLTMKGGSIHDNVGDMRGAAIGTGTTATFQLENVQVYNNEILPDKLYAGGAFYIETGAKGTVTGCTILNNKTAGDGGAAYVAKGNVTFENCEMKGNSSSQGAGLYVKDGTVVLKQCKLADNTSVGNTTKKWMAKGGALCIAKASDVTITGCEFTNNSGKQGGAIFNGGTAKVTISNSVFDANKATEHSAAIYNEATLIDNGSTYRNHVVDSTAAGSAIRLQKGTAVFEGSKFHDNKIAGDGTIYVGEAKATMKNCTLEKNTASQGAGLYIKSGEALLTSCKFADNTAVGHDEKGWMPKGGALCIAKESDVTAIGCSFTNNSGKQGGAIFNGGTSTLTLGGNGVFDSNKAVDHSAAIYNEATLIDKGTTYKNHVIDANGGGSAVRVQKGSAEFTGSKFLSNSTLGDGTIYSAVAISLTDCEFDDNTASQGAAVYYTKDDAITVDGCTFSNNKAVGYEPKSYIGKGGALRIKNGVITDSVFTGNSAVQGGAVEGTTVTVENTSFADNAAEFGRDLYLLGDSVLTGNNTFDGDGQHVYLVTASNKQSTVSLAGKTEGAQIIYTSDAIGIKLDDAFDEESKVTMIPTGYQSDIQVVGAVTEQSNTFAGATQYIDVLLPNGDTDCTLTEEGYLSMACVAIGNTTYDSLAKAVAAASEDDTIEIFKECNVAETIAIAKSVTITNRENVTLSAGKALNGAMFEVKEGATLTLRGAEGTTFTIDGTSGSSARAVTVNQGATLKMSDMTVANFNSSLNGAGTVVYNQGTATLTKVNMVSNKTTGTYAGGALRNQGGTLTVTDSVISGSESKGDGGAVYSNNANVTITGTEFTGNISGNRGGAIYSNTSGITITECTFTENTAVNYGGAITVKNGTMTNVSFSGNDAGNVGDDVYLLTDGSGVQGCVILSGKIENMNLACSSANLAMRFAGGYDLESTITISPTEGSDYQIVEDAGVSDFAGAIAMITVDSEQMEGAGFINNEGCLVQEYCVKNQTKGVSYYSLSEAFQNANEGDTIVVLKNLTMGSIITVDKSLTLTSEADVVIKKATSLTGNLFDVTAGTLTVAGTEAAKIIIDGNAGSDALDTRAIRVNSGAALQMSYAGIQNFYSNKGDTSSETGGDKGAGVAIYNAGTVTLDDVTIDNVKTDTYCAGGAIRNQNAKITMTDSVVANSESKGNGGAFYVNNVLNDGDIQLIRCTFTGNKGQNGGAIYYNDAKAIVMEDCTFTGNETNSSSGNGGAVDIRTLVMTGGTFENNVANGKGNDVYLHDNANSKVTLAGRFVGLTVVYGNANAKILIGGAIDAASEIVVTPNAYASGVQVMAAADSLTDTEIFKAATKIVTAAPDADGKVWGITIDGCLAQDYAVQMPGGEKYYSLSEALEIANEGDTITLLQDVALNETITIDKNLTFTSTAPVEISRAAGMTGEMFDVTAGNQLTIRGSQNALITVDGAAGTSAEDVRAFLVAKDGTLNLSYVTISDFYSNRSGAGVAVRTEGETVLQNVTISNVKSSTNSSGGALRNQDGNMTIENCTVTGCSTQSDGGAFYSTGTAVNDIKGSSFSENISTARGGAIYYNGSAALTVTNCTFTGNRATKAGGAMYVQSVTLSGCTFNQNYTITATPTNNTRDFGGGAVYAQTGSLKCTGCIFEGNHTDGRKYDNGGAMYVYKVSLLQLENCTFQNNYTVAKNGTDGGDSHGGAIHIYSYTNDSEGFIKGCTFTSNTAGKGDGTGAADGAGSVGNNGCGGALSLHEVKLTVTDCDFNSNKGDNRGGAIYTNGTASKMVLTLKACDFAGNLSMSTGGNRGGAMQAYTGTIYYDRACTFANAYNNAAARYEDTISAATLSGTGNLYNKETNRGIATLLEDE